MTKEEFNKLWKDSTREEILNQYYYDYKELQRTNNIINNFEKWLEDYISLLKEPNPDIYEEQTLEDLKEVLDKLRELKGASSNE